MNIPATLHAVIERLYQLEDLAGQYTRGERPCTMADAARYRHELLAIDWLLQSCEADASHQEAMGEVWRELAQARGQLSAAVVTLCAPENGGHDVV